MQRGTFLYSTEPVAAPPVGRMRTALWIDRQNVLLGLLVVIVVVADQATKWWAWRHSGTVTINSGGDELVGNLVGSWFRSTVGGALLDVVDAAVLAGAVGWIGRTRRPRPVLLSAALVVAGWFSNLSDRLGLHYFTAPGSVRGAVDFLRVGRGAVYNGADLGIVVGTMCLGVSLCWYGRHQVAPDATSALNQSALNQSALNQSALNQSALNQSALNQRVPPYRRAPNLARSTWPVVALTAVVVLSVYGVAHPGWMYVPPRLWPTA